MTLTSTSSDVGVDDLDPAGVLACLADAEAAERRAGLAKLRLALHWCVLHPATADTGAAVWGDAGLPGLSDCDEILGGEGCPRVAAFAPEPFAARLGISTHSGMQILADALDLAHRLPATWRRVQTLRVPAWKARRLAQATHHLPAESAARVDTRLAHRLDTCGPVLIDREVAHATATLDPHSHADAETSARDAWDVTLTHPADGTWAGTSQPHAVGDTVGLTKLHDLVCDHAAHLASLGDTDPLGARKAKALALIADHQTTLDLATCTGQDPVRRPSLTKTRLYLHLSLTDLDTHTIGIGEAERLGPVTTSKVRDWLAESRATIVPVIDLNQDPAVDTHDPTQTIRESVVLRDRHCVFPWCRHEARTSDLDHTQPHLDPERGGPPGQTRPTNLAPLCRRHHRAKTTRRWTYQRDRDGTYTWRGPHGSSYVVTPLGTRKAPYP